MEENVHLRNNRQTGKTPQYKGSASNVCRERKTLGNNNANIKTLESNTHIRNMSFKKNSKEMKQVLT